MRLKAAFLCLLLSSSSIFAAGFHGIDASHLKSKKRIVRVKSDRRHSLWVKMKSKDLDRVSRSLKSTLGNLRNIDVEMESYYSATGEARLLVTPLTGQSQDAAVDQVRAALQKNKDVSLVGRRRVFRITEMPGDR